MELVIRGKEQHFCGRNESVSCMITFFNHTRSPSLSRLCSYTSPCELFESAPYWHSLLAVRLIH